MKHKLAAIKARLANYPKPDQNQVHRTSLSNFTPNVAPGLEISVALISRDEIEVHYKPKASCSPG